MADLTSTDSWKNALEIYDRYNDIDKFIDYVLRKFEEYRLVIDAHEFYPPQKEVSQKVIRDFIKGRICKYYVEFSRQSGKTYMMARIESFLAYYMPLFYKESEQFKDGEVHKKLERFKDGCLIGIFAPTKEQSGIAYTQVRDAITKLFRKINVKLKIDSQSKIILPNGSKVQTYTAAPASNIEGATLHFIHIDEAQDVMDVKIAKSIVPMGTNAKALMVMTGTPSLDLNGKRIFYDAIQNEELDEFKIICDWKDVAAHNKDYGEYVLAQKNDPSTPELEWKCSYELYWPTQESSFTNMEQLNRLGDKNLNRVKTLIWNEDKSYVDNIYFGVDVGKSPDSTVLTIIKHDIVDDMPFITILDWLELNDILYDKQIDEIFSVLARYSIRAGAVDSTKNERVAMKGGDAFFDFLRLKFKGNKLPHHDIFHKYNGLTTLKWTAFNHNEIFTKLRQMWYNNQIKYPWDDSIECKKFRHQFSVLGHEYKHNLLRCHHPDKEHDDFVSSLAIAFYSANINFYNPSDPKKPIKRPVAFSGSGNIPNVNDFNTRLKLGLDRDETPLNRLRHLLIR